MLKIAEALGEPPSDDPCAIATRLCTSAAGLVRELADGAPGRRLCFVTAGAESVTPDQPPVRPALAVLSGLCKTARLEHPELHCLHIDLDPSMDAESSRDAVRAELASGAGEPLVAIRAGARYHPPPSPHGRPARRRRSALLPARRAWTA